MVNCLRARLVVKKSLVCGGIDTVFFQNKDVEAWADVLSEGEKVTTVEVAPKSLVGMKFAFASCDQETMTVHLI